MKNLDLRIALLYLFLALAIVGVIYGVYIIVTTSPEQHKEVQQEQVSNSIYEVEYDGCQYVVYKGYKAGGITHKANCNNH